MTQPPGWRGPSEILAALGEGGMGEVYRARDTTLDRDVAVNVLPDPATLPASAATLGLTGIAGAWWPARRASRLDPSSTSRCE